MEFKNGESLFETLKNVVIYITHLQKNILHTLVITSLKYMNVLIRKWRCNSLSIQRVTKIDGMIHLNGLELLMEYAVKKKLLKDLTIVEKMDGLLLIIRQ